MSETHYDGSYDAPVPHGPPVPWVDNETQSRLYAQKYHQKASAWAPLPRYVTSGGLTTFAEGASDFYLIEESQPSDIGGEIVEWMRTYAEVPPDRNECEPYVMHGQQEISGVLVEFAWPTTARVALTYALSVDGTDFTLLQPYRLSIVGGTIYATGTPPTGERLTEASKVSKWRGNIYVMRSIYATPPDFSA